MADDDVMPDDVMPDDVMPDDERLGEAPRTELGDAEPERAEAAEPEAAEPEVAEPEIVAYSTPRLEAIRAPISAAAPAGADMKYDDAFQALKDLIDTLGAATGDVDFDEIVALATTILSERSKDFTTASYLVLGLTRTAGFAGIAEGLAAIRVITEGFWEDAFPPLKRMRGRQAALQFVAERTSAWMKQDDRRAAPSDREALVVAGEQLTALQTFVMEAMGDDAPALSGLSREIREALRRLPEPEPERTEPDPEPESASETNDAEGAPDEDRTPAPNPAPASSGGTTVSVSDSSDVRSAVLEIANVLAASDPLNATAFTLRRAVIWGALAQAPPPDVFPPPPQARRDNFSTLFASANYALFVDQAESFLPQHPFPYWLDLQRLIATALKALGAPARPALIAVESAVAAFVKRLPEVPSQSFKDGTPFADPLTASWLGTLSGDGGGAGRADEDDDTGQAIEAAREQADEGDVPGAVGALMAGAGRLRDRFERSVASAEMCLGAGRPDVALGLLDGATETVEVHGLEVWDPESAARVYRLVHVCAQATDDYGRSEEAFQRLIKLDPGHAIRSTPAP